MRIYQVRIRNFRGIEDLTIDLEETTVLIGENNAGKTSVLEAIHLSLGKSLTGRSLPFSEYDYRQGSQGGGSSGNPEIVIDFRFRELQENEWPDGVLQSLANVLQIRPDSLSEIRFRISSSFDETIGDYAFEASFLDLNDNRLQPSSNSNALRMLHLFSPAFLLRAVRDPSQEFGSKSQYWRAFTKNPTFEQSLVEQIETSIADINQLVLDSHHPFGAVREGLRKTADFVPLGQGELVTIEAVPAKVSELLERTQVKLNARGNVALPIRQHGAGTQSLSVMFLFEAFLKTRLAETYDRETSPILAIEEPESHLHPSAAKSLWSEVASIPGQKIVATHSGYLMSEVPLSSIRRLATKNGVLSIFQVPPNLLSPSDERKIGYHVRAKRGNLLFARVWFLVEGESEYWFMPEAARLLGSDLDRAGVCCVEFSQVGLATLLKLAVALGIEWHVFADGDPAGIGYCRTADRFVGSDRRDDRITKLNEKDLEHALWQHGYSQVYIQAAGVRQPQAAPTPGQVDTIIKQAYDAASKPGLVVEVLAAAAARGASGLPAEIHQALQAVLRYANQ